MLSSEPKNGAYTELFAGLSPEITENNNGGWSKLCLDVLGVDADWIFSHAIRTNCEGSTRLGGSRAGETVLGVD